MNLMLTIIAFLVGFSALVFIHEWGHYAMARLFKIRVLTFSIGFGREIFGWTSRSGVRWKFSLLPLGGYVRFFGDASPASNPDAALGAQMSDEDKRDCLHYKPVWQRMLVTVAGPFVNLIAAAIVFAGFYGYYGRVVAPPIVDQVAPASAAEAAGLITGDLILKIGNRPIESFSDIRDNILLYPGQSLDFTVERSGHEQIIPILVGVAYQEDRFGNRYAYGQLGISAGAAERQKLGVILALKEGFKETNTAIKNIFTSIGQMIIGLRSIEEMGGPLRIIDMTGAAAAQGLQSFLWFLALISVNLGVVNLLPIPALDGGHLLFYIIEAVKGSPLSEKAQKLGFAAGFAFLIFFMIFVTVNDLQSMAL